MTITSLSSPSTPRIFELHGKEKCQGSAIDRDEEEEEEKILFQREATLTRERDLQLGEGECELIRRMNKDGEEEIFLRFWKCEEQTIELLLLSKTIQLLEEHSPHSSILLFRSLNLLQPQLFSLYSLRFQVNLSSRTTIGQRERERIF